MKPIPPRGVRRLEMAIPLLLNGYGKKVAPRSEETSAHAALRVIEGMNPEIQKELKSLVDWVEDYDRTEARNPYVKKLQEVEFAPAPAPVWKNIEVNDRVLLLPDEDESDEEAALNALASAEKMMI